MRIDESVVIDRPPEAVFALVADLERTPEWQGSLDRIELETDGPIRAHTRGTEIRSAGGRRLESQFEVTELEPGRRLAISTRSGTAEADATFDVVATDRGTRVTSTVDLRLRGVLRFIEAGLRGRIEQQTRDDLARLKRLAEGETS